MKKKPKSPPAPSAPLSSVDEAPPPPPAELGSQAAYDLFLAEVNKLDRDKLAEYRGDPQLSYQNMKRGVANVLAEVARIERELPGANLEAIRTLPQLGQGLIFAALQVNRRPGSPGTVEALLAKAHPVRRRLLRAAQALAESDVIPSAEVELIRKGRGKSDMANDCVALAALFRKYDAKIAGRTAILPADIAEADDVGSKLQTLLKPVGTPIDGRLTPEIASAVEIRNRFSTLLEERHQHVWRIGAWLWGRDGVDERVPPLQSRVVERRGSGGAPAEPLPV